MVNFICQVDWLGVAWIKHYFWVCLWWCLERLAFKSVGFVDYAAQRGWWWWWCSVTQACPILCDSMDYSTPGLPVPHQLPNFVQAHVHCFGDAIQPSLFSFCPQSFPASGTFPMSQLFTSDDQSTGVSASASVFLTSIQGWFPLWLNCLISCCPRVSQKSCPAPQFEVISSLSLRLLYGPALTTVYDHWGNHSLVYTDLCWQSNISAFQHTV